MGVFSAHVTHNLDAKTIENQPKEWCKADGIYPSKKTHSKGFGSQIGEQSVATCTFSTT